MVLKIPRKTQTKGERHEREGLGFRVQGLGGGDIERDMYGDSGVWELL
jgi:hypothetical protein